MVKCYILDSFAVEPGTGNPAAVVLLPQDTDPNQTSTRNWMQKVAAEFNLSETAFCWPYYRYQEAQAQEEGTTEETETETETETIHHWNIRYFTPTIEVALCGHATLASAAVLYNNQTIINIENQQEKTKRKIVFHALNDTLLTMELDEDDDDNDPRKTNIVMEFPYSRLREFVNDEDRKSVKSMLLSSFSCDEEPLYMGLSDIGDILVELTPKAFHSIGYDNLDYSAMMKFDGYTRGIIICCACEAPTPLDNDSTATSNADFLSRFFGPKAGINEDPVTGSAHCTLGPYFSKKLNKQMVVGKQCSKRGGYVRCFVKDDAVRLTGTAIMTMSGKLHF